MKKLSVLKMVWISFIYPKLLNHLLTHILHDNHMIWQYFLRLIIDEKKIIVFVDIFYKNILLFFGIGTSEVDEEKLGSISDSLEKKIK